MKIYKGNNAYVEKQFLTTVPFAFEPTNDDKIRASTPQSQLFEQRKEDNEELKEADIALEIEGDKVSSLT